MKITSIVAHWYVKGIVVMYTFVRDKIASPLLSVINTIDNKISRPLLDAIEDEINKTKEDK